MEANKLALAVLSVVVVSAVHAQESPKGTVGELSTIQSDTLILKAKVAKATAQADLDAKSSKPRDKVTMVDAPPPVVKNVYGVGAKMYAQFVYSNGVAIDARAGDTIPGGYKVAVVTMEKVELARGKEIIPLGFSGAAPVQGSPMQATIPSPMVPLAR